MLVTKEQIIEAIMVEPLKPNNWFHVKYDSDFEPINPTTCEVCAVGAVLRKGCNVTPSGGGYFYPPDTRKSLTHVDDILKEDYPVSYGDSRSRYEITKELFESEDHWLNKLSVVFETMCYIATDNDTKPLTKLMIKAIRLELADYVKEEFPETIEVAI